MRSAHLLLASAPLALSLGACGSGPAPQSDDSAAIDANAPASWPLVFESSFEDAGSIEAFVFSDDAGWRWSEEQRALELHAGCDYAPPHRSPLGIALLAGLELGAFDLEFEVRQSGEEYGHRDLCFFTGWQAPDRYYYTHLATTPDDRANNIFVVDGAPRTRLCEVPAVGTDWGSDAWHTVRIERRLDPARMSVFFDDVEQAVLETDDVRFARGRVGFGSFDDTGFLRALRVWAPDARELTPPLEAFPATEPNAGG